MAEITEITEMTATEFKKKLTKALLKLEPDNVDLNMVLEIMKKLKITKKKSSKRPLTDYNIFMQTSMKQIRIDQPTLKQKDVMKEAVILWNANKNGDSSS